MKILPQKNRRTIKARTMYDCKLSMLIPVIALFFANGCSAQTPWEVKPDTQICSKLDKNEYRWLIMNAEFLDFENKSMIPTIHESQNEIIQNGKWVFHTPTSGYVYQNTNILKFNSLDEIDQLHAKSPLNLESIVKNKLNQESDAALNAASIIGLNEESSVFYVDRYHRDISNILKNNKNEIRDENRSLVRIQLHQSNWQSVESFAVLKTGRPSLFKWKFNPTNERIYSLDFNEQLKKVFISSEKLLPVEIANETFYHDFPVIEIGDNTFLANRFEDQIVLMKYNKGDSKPIGEKQISNLTGYGKYGDFLWLKDNNKIALFDSKRYLLDRKLSSLYNELSIHFIFSPLPNKFIGRAQTPRGAFKYFDLSESMQPKLICQSRPLIKNTPTTTPRRFQNLDGKIEYTLRSVGSDKVIVYLHGGPHEMTGHEFHRVDMFLDKGYDIIHLNYPGSTGFGIEYQNQGKLKDAAETVFSIEKFLQSMTLSEYKERVLIGHSYGSYLGYFLSKNPKNQIDSSHLVNGVFNLKARVESVQNRTLFHKGIFKFAVQLITLEGFKYNSEFDPAKNDHRFANPVFIYVDNTDKVVSYNDGASFFKSFEKEHPQHLRVVDIGGHVPNTIKDWKKLNQAISENLNRIEKSSDPIP